MSSQLALDVTANVDGLLGSSVPCLAVDGQGIIRAASPGTYSLCAVVLNSTLTDAFKISQEALGEHLASHGDRALVGEATRRDGSRIQVIAQAMALPIGAMLMLTDLSPARRAEEARFDATPYPVLRLSENGRILFANTPAGEALGAASSCLSGQMLQDFFPDAARDELTRTFSCEPVQTLQFDLPAPDALRNASSVSEVRLSLMPDLGLQDRVLGWIAAIAWDPWETWRDRICEAVNQGAGWESALQNALDVLRKIVPYDRASFGIIGGSGKRFRATLVHPLPEKPWPRRWVTVPAAMYERLKDGPFVERDLARIVESFPELAEDPIVRLNLDDGIKAFVVLPVGAQDHPDAVLTLSARNQEAFDGPALALLSVLRIETQLSALLRRADREEAVAVGHIADHIVGATSIVGAAEVLLTGLVEQFQWDHAALFLADPQTKRTLLFRQHPILNADGTRNDLAIAADYTQPLDPDDPPGSGMLGETYWKRRPLVVKDTAPRKDGKREHNFRYAAPALPQRSAMTVPVWLDGEIRWLLDITSRTTRAFSDDDKEVVSKIVRSLERRIALLRERLLTKELLEISEQGVVVTDSSGKILRANCRARDLLRLVDEPEGWGMLSSYGADTQAAELLGGRSLVERKQVRVGPSGGVGNLVLASRRDLASEAGESVWLFTDLRIEEWEHDSSFVESAIREVARQARGPLMLATSFVKRMAAGASSDLAARAIVELGKATLTYDRIAESLAARKEPVRERQILPTDLLLADLRKSLQPRDAARIAYRPLHKNLKIEGDRGRIELALRLILGGVLARSAEDRISVVFRRRSSNAVLTLSIDGAPASHRRLRTLPIKPGEPLETASIIIEAHGGRIAAADMDTGTPRLEVTLPLCEHRNVD